MYEFKRPPLATRKILVLSMFRLFGIFEPKLNQIWAWLPHGHQLVVGVHDPLKILVTGLSLLANLLSLNQVLQKIRVNPSLKL